MVRRLLLIAALAGCWTGSSPPPPPSNPPPRPIEAPRGDGPGSARREGSGSGDLGHAGCPATFAAAPGPCVGTAQCSYPEGTCTCSTPPWCGGAAPPREYAKRSWQCTPKVRADGCPGAQPPDGSPCTISGKTCDYTCSCMLTATCTAGTWQSKHGPCKP